MNHTSPRYADWKAPDEDGQLLLWPDAASLQRQTRDNHHQLSRTAITLQNVPLAEVRAAQRHAIGHLNDDQLLIATGHQTELYHPGVWVKDALTHALARKLDGRAWHFAVDTDSPKHLHLRWPGGSMPITQDPRINSAPWSALLAAASPAQIDEIQSAFAQAKSEWDFDPMTGAFLSHLKGNATSPSLAPQLTTAIHQLDESLGLQTTTALMSPLWMREPFLVFAHHLLSRADHFAASYNSALAAYRKEQGVTSPGRPMPDLEVKPDEVETAFWLDDLKSQSRSRLVVQRKGERWSLSTKRRLAAPIAEHAAEIFEFNVNISGWDAAARFLSFLQTHQLRLAPRALPLTTFFRLCLADQYVHGIGGGRYDQVSDRIIADFFHLEPPCFSVTTATLYFPAARGQKRINLRPLLQEGRRLRHGSFWREKRDMADRIATLPRRSQQRRQLFFEIHAKLARQASSDTMREWSQRLNHATEEQMRQKSVFDRELFFAIQPQDRLRDMISRYDAALT